MPPETPTLEAALGALSAAVRAEAHRLAVPLPPELDLHLALGCSPAEQVRRLVAELRRSLEALRPAGDLSREGRVWCLRCESMDCAHAAPPGPEAVFVGYAPTGWPRWAEFTQVCLARRLAGLDGLFSDPPAVLGWVDGEAELVGEVLAEYAGTLDRWRPVGQVVVGLIPRPELPKSVEESMTSGGAARPSGRVALSVQVVAVHLPGAPLSLRVSLLGLTSEAITDAATAGPPRGVAEGLRRTVIQARRQVARLGRRLATTRGEDFDERAALGSLLGRIRSDLLRIFEPRLWRTRHADDRHQAGARPTETALGDAREAGDDRLFADTRRETVIVVGPRGRAHVFTQSGRHVTSLRLEPGELGRRTGRQRWSPLSPEAAQAFREALQGA